MGKIKRKAGKHFYTQEESAQLIELLRSRDPEARVLGETLITTSATYKHYNKNWRKHNWSRDFRGFVNNHTRR